MDIRRDGAAALDWVARYLERVGELPVLAQVEPGRVRAGLPPSPPERGEPFAALLRDLDEVLLPGVTHWQHPRYFAYFANTASEPAILAEMIAAALNQVGFLWRTSPALTELEVVVLDWLAQLLGLPPGWHGHIEDTASTSTFAALVAAREAAPGRRVVAASEHAHSSVEKACRMAELTLRKVPVDAAYRLRADALDLRDACAVVATVGTTSTTSVDPVPAIAEACARHGKGLIVDAMSSFGAIEIDVSRYPVDAVIADTVTVKRILPNVITKMNLPVTGPDGQPMSYSLDHKEGGKRLQEQQTLPDAQVRNGDHLIVYPEIVAGYGANHRCPVYRPAKRRR